MDEPDHTPREKEGIWRKRTYERIELVDPGAITEAMVYTLANAVAAGLVPQHKQWPGLHSRPEDLRGQRYRATAEGKFFERRFQLLRRI